MTILATIWATISPFISKILVYVLAVLLGISLIYNAVDYFKIHSLDKQVTSLTNDNKGLKDDVASRDATILDQNNKILAAANTAKALQSQLDDTKSKLNDQATTNAALVLKLKSQPAPKTCSDAVEYLKTNSDVFKW